jgi:diadenosine tetraphosphate (Ap4A) HIT family hydrolase
MRSVRLTTRSSGEVVRRGAAIAREKGFADRGFRTVFNTNAEAGQTVFTSISTCSRAAA